MTSDATWPKLKVELARLYAILGDARDADVMAGLACRKRYRTWAAGIIADDDKNHDKIHRRVVAGLRSKRFERLTDRLSHWVERGPWLTRRDDERRRVAPLWPYCRRQLELWRARLIRKGRGLATMGGKRRHRLRIRVKRYRYVLESLGEICQPAARSKLRRLHKPAKELQGALGDLRDLQRLRRVGPSSRKPPGYAKRKAQLLAAARAAWRDLKSPLLLPRF
jgi:CHAD domain-containing protein